MPEDRADNGVNTIKASELIKFAEQLIKAEEEIDETTSAARAARGVKSGIMKSLKKAGTDMDAFDDLLRLMRVTDDEERNRREENKYLYAQWLNVKLWREPSAEQPQGALFVDDPEAQEAAERFQETVETANGRAAAQGGGLASDNGHQPGTNTHAAWARGFDGWHFDNPGKQVPVKASTAPKGRTKKPAAEAAEPKPKGKGGRPKKDAAATEAVH